MSSTSIRRARSPCSAVTRARRRESWAGDRRSRWRTASRRSAPGWPAGWRPGSRSGDRGTVGSMTTRTSARLAIDGGEPVRSTMLPYARQSISNEDVAAVTAALRSDWLTTGPRVPAFEEALAAFAGVRHAIAFSSGTAALHGAAVAAGLGPGDEAVTTPMTF